MNSALPAVIEARNLDLSYDDYVVMRNLNFSVRKGDIFIVMGGSGCGKSTLLKALIGLLEPIKGDVLYDGRNFWKADDIEQENIMRRFGVLYQGGALLDGVHGVLVPGGFGNRGIEGKIQAVKYARENKIPFLGICLGMQCAVIEFARNVCGLAGANSAEFDPATAYPVIDLMEEQKKIIAKGGTMRLGSYPCALKQKTKAQAAYATENIAERHRHRYEFNNIFRDRLEGKGLIVAGVCPQGNLIEIVELNDHPWFVGCQFHPEFKSRPLNAHPLFREFIAAAVKKCARVC